MTAIDRRLERLGSRIGRIRHAALTRPSGEPEVNDVIEICERLAELAFALRDVARVAERDRSPAEGRGK